MQPMQSPKVMIWFFIFIALILLGGFYLWCLIFSKAPNQPLAAHQVRVGDATFTVEMATTTAQKMRGLSSRESLAEGSGMLFTFNPGVQRFWMKDMNFPIDIIWIAGGKVAGFAQNAEPQPGIPLWNLTIYTSPDGVDKVLEANAGTVAKSGIKIGEVVTEGPGTE